MQSDRKKILIVASHAKNDEEIKGMAAAIASSKSKDHDVTLITCHTGKLDELKLQSGDYTQVILCAHGRYYGKDNLNKPGVGLFDRNKPYDEKNANERHIAEQSFDRVAGFLTNVIINNPNLKNVKLVVCESALNENTKLLKKENQQDNELLLPGSKSAKAIIAPQSIDDNLFEKDRTLKKDAVIDQYSNLEVLIGLITKKYEVSDKVNVKERRVNFQGINGVGYLTSKNTRVRAFDQKNLQEFRESQEAEKKPKKKTKEDPFETKYVDKYELTPKVQHEVRLIVIKPVKSMSKRK